MVRIKKNVKIPKDSVINVRCTDQQKATLESVAASQGLGLSTWLLHLALADATERQEKARR